MCGCVCNADDNLFQDDLGEAKPLQPQYSDFIGGIVSAGPGTSLLVVRAHSIVLPSYASTGGRRPAPAPKDYISRLVLSTVERAKNEFTTRASTLRRSKRNRAAEQVLKRASWNSDITSTPIDQMDNNRGMRGANDDASDRSTSTKSSQLTNASSNSSYTAGGGGGVRTTSGAKKKTPAPPPKPTTTILSLEDRDLVIIDGNDIKESVQNESEVIVVDHPPKEVSTAASNSGEVDLMDILGNNWPALAGDTAHGLNAAERRPSNGQVMKPNLGELPSTRNKSMNIISHLKHSNRGTTLSRNSSTAGHQYQQESGGGGGGASGSTNSSFESSHSGSQASDRRKSK